MGHRQRSRTTPSRRAHWRTWWTIGAGRHEAVAMGRRQALAHLARALTHGVWLSDSERGRGCSSNRPKPESSAVSSKSPSAPLARPLRRANCPAIRSGPGNALRISARLDRQLGQPDQAEQMSEEALDVMRDHRDSWQYAMARAGNRSWTCWPTAMNSDRAFCRGHGQRGAPGTDDIYLHALTNANAARSCRMSRVRLPTSSAPSRKRIGATAPPTRRALRTSCTSPPRIGITPGLIEHSEQGINAAIAGDNAPLEADIRGIRADAARPGTRRGGHCGSRIGALRDVSVRHDTLHGAMALARARVRLGLPEGGVPDEAAPCSRRDVI